MFLFSIGLKPSVFAPFNFENARNGSFYRRLIFETPKMAHFTAIQFLKRPKWFILPPFNFQNAQNDSFWPFLLFIGPKMVHFTRFQFSLGFKSLISAVFIFRWSYPVSVQPFFSRKFSQKSTFSFHNEQFSAKIT